MKKFILIISLVFVTLGFVSCNPKFENIEDTSVSAREFEYKGHTYIQFEDNNHYGTSYLHSPDCKCFNDTVK